MSDNTVLVPEKALGGRLGKLTQKELICLVKKLCEIAASERGENGFRGGFRPGNIYIENGKVFVGPADKAGEDGWTKDELEYMAPEVFWNGKKAPVPTFIPSVFCFSWGLTAATCLSFPWQTTSRRPRQEPTLCASA